MASPLRTISFSHSHFRFSRSDRTRIPGSAMVSDKRGHAIQPFMSLLSAEMMTNTRVTQISFWKKLFWENRSSASGAGLDGREVKWGPTCTVVLFRTSFRVCVLIMQIVLLDDLHEATKSGLRLSKHLQSFSRGTFMSLISAINKSFNFK